MRLRKYKVTVTERVTKTVKVEAIDAEEAEQKAESGEYTLIEESDIESIDATVIEEIK